MHIAKEFIRAACGGYFPSANGFSFETVDHFKDVDGTLQGISGGEPVGPALKLVVVPELGEKSDEEMVDWVYRKLALYQKPSDDGRTRHMEIMGWLHVACHTHEQLAFYSKEYSRICRERDELKIQLMRATGGKTST